MILFQIKKFHKKMVAYLDQNIELVFKLPNNIMSIYLKETNLILPITY
jgi:hypothetical protein